MRNLYKIELTHGRILWVVASNVTVAITTVMGDERAIGGLVDPEVKSASRVNDDKSELLVVDE
jgi:hypothetical protein